MRPRQRSAVAAEAQVLADRDRGTADSQPYFTAPLPACPTVRLNARPGGSASQAPAVHHAVRSLLGMLSPAWLEQPLRFTGEAKADGIVAGCWLAEAADSGKQNMGGQPPFRTKRTNRLLSACFAGSASPAAPIRSSSACYDSSVPSSASRWRRAPSRSSAAGAGTKMRSATSFGGWPTAHQGRPRCR